MIYLFLALATWRTATLLVVEPGPFMIFYKLRVWAGIEYDQNHEIPELVPETFFAQLLSCVWCATIWTGIGWTLLYLLLPDIALYASLPFAFSAAAILFDRVLQ
jgi:hypothetical protein